MGKGQKAASRNGVVKSEVKQENYSKKKHEIYENQSSQLGKNPSSSQRESDETKIIKDFMLKRKLLMKALKQKHKQKNPKLLTFQSFQNKEGIIMKIQNNLQNLSNHKNLNQSSNPTNQKSLSSSLQQTNEIILQQNQTQDQKTNIGIQTQISNNKKINKKFRISSKPQEYLAKFLTDPDSLNNKNNTINRYLPIRRKKDSKDIQMIKNQLKNLFSKQNKDQNQVYKPQLRLKDIFSVIEEANDRIQSYYGEKLLKKLIINQFRNKVDKKFKQRQKKYGKQKNTPSSSLYSIRKQSNYLSDEIIPMTQKISSKKIKRGKRRYLNKKSLKQQQRRRRQSRKILNQRFKLILTQNQTIKSKKNISRQKEQHFDQCDYKNKQNHIKHWNKQEEDQNPQNYKKSWRNQFKQIQKMFLEKYHGLKVYLAVQKPIELHKIPKKIGSKTKLTNKKNPKNKEYHQPQYFEYQSFLDPNMLNHETIPIQNIGFKEKKFQAIQAQKLKQVRMSKTQEDQFGKSFDINELHEVTYEDNFNCQVFEKSNILSQIISQSSNPSVISKKRTSSSLSENSFNFGSSFFSNQKSFNHGKHHQDSSIAIRLKPNQYSFFTGQKSRQYFNMSQEIQVIPATCHQTDAHY